MKLPTNPHLSDYESFLFLQQLLDRLRQVYPLSEQAISDFGNCLIPVHYKKRQVILDYGERCNYCIFLMSGIVKSIFLVDGVERIVWFMRKGELVIAMHSWYNQEPSEEKLVAVDDCIGFAFSYEDVSRLCETYHDYALLILKLTEQYYSFSIQRTKWMQYSPEERLKEIHRLYPDLFLEIPSTDLSRFLGISRETLNRIRKALH